MRCPGGGAMNPYAWLLWYISLFVGKLSLNQLIRLRGPPYFFGGGNEYWIGEDGVYRLTIMSRMMLVIFLLDLIVCLVVANFLFPYFFLGMPVAFLFGAITSIPFGILVKKRRRKLSSLPLDESLKLAKEKFVWDDIQTLTVHRNRKVRIELKRMPTEQYARTLDALVEPSEAESLKTIASSRIGDRFKTGDSRF
jgi:hypothetical protein